jgi:hypothetical protein
MHRLKGLNTKTSIMGAFVGVVALALVTTGTGLTNVYAHGGGGNEGCTPGFWRNHEEIANSIVIPGFGGRTADEVTVNEFFGTSLESSVGDISLADAVKLQGNTDLQQLTRQAVSALFNSLTIDSRFSDGQVRSMFRDAVDPNYQQIPSIADDDDLESIKDAFDAANNLGCPL